MSDLCGTVAGMVTPMQSMSTEERHSKFLSYLTGARYVLSAVSVLVVAQPILEVPEGPMNYPVCVCVSLLAPCAVAMTKLDINISSVPKLQALTLTHLVHTEISFYSKVKNSLISKVRGHLWISFISL
jgi:hypothetical protein